MAPEIGSKITVQNRKLRHMGGLTKGETEQQTEEVGQMETRKKWVSARWDERFEKWREINEVVQWPVSRESRARQKQQQWPELLWEGKCVSGVDTEREKNVFVFEKHFYRWQVKSQSLQSCLRLESVFICSSLSLFISQVVILSKALLSIWYQNWYVWWKACPV